MRGAKGYSMPKKKKDDGLADIHTLPDFAVVNNAQAAKLMGMSIDTLDRLDAEGDAPPIVILSARCRGRRIGDIKIWIAKGVRRADAPREPLLRRSTHGKKP
jgi:hypothetical protein